MATTVAERKGMRKVSRKAATHKARRHSQAATKRLDPMQQDADMAAVNAILGALVGDPATDGPGDGPDMVPMPEDSLGVDDEDDSCYLPEDIFGIGEDGDDLA